jgi:hypothetical protein
MLKRVASNDDRSWRRRLTLAALVFESPRLAATLCARKRFNSAQAHSRVRVVDRQVGRRDRPRTAAAKSDSPPPEATL